MVRVYSIHTGKTGRMSAIEPRGVLHLTAPQASEALARELAEAVAYAVGRAGRPMTFGELRRQLCVARAYRLAKALDQLVKAGRLAKGRDERARGRPWTYGVPEEGSPCG